MTFRISIIVGLTITLVCTAPVSAQELVSGQALEQLLSELQMPLNPDDSPEPLDSSEYDPEEVWLENDPDQQAYLERLDNEQGAHTEPRDLPSVDEIREFARIYHEEGELALAQTPYFATILTDEVLAAPDCGTFIPIIILSIAGQLDLDGSLGLQEEVAAILTYSDDVGTTLAEKFGEDWHVEMPEGAFFDPLLQQDPEQEGAYPEQEEEAFPINTPPGGDQSETIIRSDVPPGPVPADPSLNQTIVLDPSKTWTVSIAKPRSGGPKKRGTNSMFDAICKKRAASGVANVEYWLEQLWASYTVHSEFTIRYQLCGTNGISEDEVEWWPNKEYLMPDGTKVPLKKCKYLSKSCAPQHIQMIAQNILYERKILGQAGFKLPGHWMIHVHGGNIYNRARSSAFLGNITLHGPAHYFRGLRNVTFHEYFHAVETEYGSEANYVGNGLKTGEFAGQVHGFTRSTIWWSQLESLASWAERALGGDGKYPTYTSLKQKSAVKRVEDARTHLFWSVYHPLEYGYMGERFAALGNRAPSNCLGCDGIKQYMNILDKSGFTWVQQSTSGATVFFLSNKLKFKWRTFYRDFHMDLLFSGMDRKLGVRSGNFRFLNRKAPLDQIKPWPPAMQTIPVKINRDLGKCSSSKPLYRRNAGQVGSRYVHVFTCDAKMSPEGALYFSIPLEKGKVPDDVIIRAVGIKLNPADMTINTSGYRTLPGQRINGNLQVHLVPTEVAAGTPVDSASGLPLDFRTNKTLSAFENREAYDKVTLTGFRPAYTSATHLSVVVRYPYAFGEWWRVLSNQRKVRQTDNFVVRLVVAGYWDN